MVEPLLRSAALTALVLGACADASSPPAAPADAAASAGVDAAPSAGNGVRLPFAVDDYFIASGYMGDGAEGGIARAEQCATPRPGAARGLCHRFAWTPGAMGWAGVFWQFPEGNWGEMPGLPIASGATTVEFFAWGASGGEQVKFVVGMDGVDGFHTEVDVELGPEPTRISIDVSGQPYGEVTGGFGWVASGAAGPGLTFFIDDVQWK